MAQSRYLGYKDLFEGFSKTAQVIRADILRQSEQASKGIQGLGQLNLERSKTLQAIQADAENQLKQGKTLEQLRQRSLEEISRKFSGLSLQLIQTKTFLEQGLGIRSDLENPVELPLPKPRQNPNPITPKQTPNLPQQSIFRPQANLQKQVLIAIYNHLQPSQEQFIKWQPSNWFGNRIKSRSDQSNWSNALRNLIRKELVQLHSSTTRKSARNRGNAGTFITLTPKGYQEAKWLTQND